MYHDANVVVSVTPAFKADLVCRGVDPAKIHVVLNGVDLSRYRPLPKDQTLLRRLEIQGKFVVGYLGTHGMAHTLDKVVDAATLLRDHPRIVFLFVGAGAKRAELEETVKARNLTNVRLLPSQSKALMPALWSVVDVALVPLRNHPLFATVIPSKIFEAMGTGTPVLLSAPEGDAVDLVRAAGCGVHVRPEDAPVMAKAIAALEAGREECIALGAAGVAAAPQYSRPKQAALMLSVIEAAAGKSTPAGLIEPTR
jgi:glycosyltransferase involved in cell wall biosynthesis